MAGLQRPKLPRLRLDRFPPGVDGIHLDVALGASLEKAARLYVAALLQENLAHLWGQALTATSDAVLPMFRDQVREHHHAAVREARDGAALERLQLFQLAVLKLVLSEIDGELARVRNDIDHERAQRERQAGTRSLQLHREIALLGRYAPHVRYRTARRAIRELIRLEHAGLRNLRQSVLGRSWPVAEAMLANPFLQLDGIGGLRDFKESYPVVLHDLAVARRIGDCLFTALSGWLPERLAIATVSRQSRRQKVAAQGQQVTGTGRLVLQDWARGLVGTEELEAEVVSWLDEPESVVALLGGSVGDWPQAGPWPQGDVAGLQRHLNTRFIRLVARDGLLRRVSAAYALADMYPSLGVVDAEGPVFDYLAGDADRRSLQRRLDALSQDVDSAQITRRIDERSKEFRRRRKGNRQRLMARLAGDYCALRRDVKLAVQAYAALAQIRVLADPASLELSRANNTLQLFCQQAQLPDTRGSLVGHVIVRADVRGSNDLVAALSRRGINPAAFFSRHLYDPLAQLLDQFDARRVFIEAGGVVLTTLEYAGDGLDQLAASRASALAILLLGRGAALNVESERLGLPGLEFSVGIVYADSPPTYLYDRSRRVLVSSANTQASRIASCHALFRQRCALPEGRSLCVASPVPGPDDPNTSGDLVRYNVNGIELDGAAFARLSAELRMRKVRVRDPQHQRPVKLHVGQCPDAKGSLHWLVVREQPVKLWMGRQLLESPDEGRTFFELVTDQTLVERVRERLDQSGQAKSATVRAARL
jgi:hypothetical protein